MDRRAYAVALFAAFAVAGPQARAGDAEDILAAHTAFIAAFNAGDADRAFSFLADDFVGMIEGAPTKDKAGYRAAIDAFFAGYRATYQFRVDEAVVSGNWAFERLRYSGTITPKAGGEARPTSWRAIAIWRRDPDGWKVARYIRTPDPKAP